MLNLKNNIIVKKGYFILLFVFLSSSAQATITLPPQDYVDTIRKTDFYSNRSNDKFANALANEYKSYALYKAQYTPDYANANHFAAKALNAYHGERVKPDNIYKKRLPETSIIEISNYYDDLLYLLETDLVIQYPQLMAEAQAKFDCWVDSESNGLSQKQSINCLNRFMKARKHLFNKLNPECNNCKKPETKITKKQSKFSGKFLPIPKWPNLPVIANNPPIPTIRHTIVKETANSTTQPTPTITKVDTSEIENSLIKIEDLITSINSNPPVIQNSDGEKTIVVSNPNSATKQDIDLLKQAITDLDSKIQEIQNTKPIDNTEELTNLQNQLFILEDKIDEINTYYPEEEEFNTIDEDDYVETEIISAPSDLLPFEIFFDWDKSDVDYKFLPQLKDISEKALSSKEIIIIQGHTDTSGTKEHNQKLSTERAENVGKIITSYGIPKEKIIIQGLGSEDQKIPTKDGVKKPENRRVVIK